MSTIKQVVGSLATVSFSGTNLSTLANGTYVQSNVTTDVTTNQPLDLLVEFSVTAGTVSGNKQAILFAQASVDNSAFQTGPTSGTTTTDESSLQYIGSLPLTTSSTLQRKFFSVAAAYGGVLPPYLRFVVKNDSGAAFTTGTVKVAEVSSTVT